ncbi:MAG: hypothetical protein JXP73_15960 [Deltaproteobacteria bacterium]|nr:hypothetical protein [Deltaproteobacteria bacterium]
MRTTIAAFFLGALLAAASSGCKTRVPVIASPFGDNFERAELGADWRDTGTSARIKNGKLNVAKAYNHPVWLRRKLPRDAQIDFDAVSMSPAGDIKVELYGDGESFDHDKGRYDPTGYMIVFGGWNNSRSIIGRLGEHDEAVKAAYDRVGSEPLVLPGQTYHFTITRKGGAIEWKLGGRPYLSWNDPEPLFGSGHEYFAFNDWESDVSFDNLTIKPVP